MRAFAMSMALLGVVAMTSPPVQAQERNVVMPTEEQIRKMEAAAPADAPADPARPRKVLVWGHLWTHDPNLFAAECLKIMGRKSGAFEATVSEDPLTLLPDSLSQYDAVVMNNIHERDPFLPQNLQDLPQDEQKAAQEQAEAIQQSILDFVNGGKGIVGIHAATAACQNWPEYGEMMGGYYGGHITDDVPVRLDEPEHPMNACFKGESFRIRDEIYIFREPYSREKLRVLLSLDLTQMDDPGQRPDKDYAITWIREYGGGRVFYCSLGHVADTYWNPVVLEHFLAGIQFALGDLKADAAPARAE